MASATVADWRKEMGDLRIGIVTGFGDQSIIDRMEPFRLAVQERLAIAVEFYPARDLSDLVRAHAEGTVDYAIFSSLGFAAAEAVCECLEPLVVASSGDGSTAIRFALISRRDGGIGQLRDLVGKTVLVPPREDILATDLPIYEWGNADTPLLESEVNLEYAASAEEAVNRFASGEGDALIGWSSFTGDLSAGYSAGTLAMLNHLGKGPENYSVVWRSMPVPNRVHSVTRKLAGELKRELRQVLTEMSQSDPLSYDIVEPVYGGGFLAARDGQFADLVAFVKAVSSGKGASSAESDPKTGSIQ